MRFTMSSILPNNFLTKCKGWISAKWDTLHENFLTDRMIWCCVMAIVVCVCSDKIFSLWIGWFGVWLDKFYEIVVDRKILLMIAIVSTLWLGIKNLVILCRLQSVSPVLIPLGFATFWLIVKWPGVYLPIVDGFTFRQLLAGLLIAAPILRICKYICKYIYVWWKNRKESSESSTDNPIGLVSGHPEYYEDGRMKFATALATLIGNTDLKKRGMTIGITGEWGAGKTLVLREVKSILKKRMEVIEFYPWQSSSPANLIEDFFLTLASHLHSHRRSLGRKLENYADKLIELDIDKKINFFAKIGRWISGGYLSINDARGKIEKELDTLPKSIAVIIDDLDRLDKDELFEVLRLVRNTAHFRNIAYIIAYDPDYTAKMIGRKGIENAEEYLHKIFMLSINLPSYEHFTYVEVITKIVEQHFGKESDDCSTLKPMVTLQSKGYTEYFLTRFIRNYRQAVQFGHFLCANFLMLKNMSPGFSKDFDLDDWYYLQMLRFFFPDAYDVLQQKPESFFYPQYIKTDSLYKFDKETFAKSGIQLPAKAISIISTLFSNTPYHAKPTGIAYTRNFYNYFAFRVLSTEVSESDFMEMLNGIRSRETTIREWLHRRPKVWGSVDSHFISHDIGKLTNEQIKIFIESMLWWYVIAGSEMCMTAIRDITHHTASSEQLDIAAEAYLTTLQSMIADSNVNAVTISKLIVLQAPYPEDPTSSDDDAPEYFWNLLAADMAEELLEKLINREFENGEIESTDDISDRGSTLFKMMRASRKSISLSANDYRVYKNYALRPVDRIFNRYFSSHPGFMKGHNLERIKEVFGYTPTGDQEVDMDNAEGSDVLIRSIFENYENIRNIIFKWFKGTKEEKNKLIKDLHIEK